ncbi:hypothetical protein CRYUN_Cryun26dG0105200 [Craigia yunnanensis]
MPSSPKFFHTCTSPLTTRPSRSMILIFSALFTFAIISFLFSLSSFLSSDGFGYRCRSSDPRFVRVLWNRIGNGNNGGVDGDNDNGMKMHKVMGFVRIQTGFSLTGQRRSLRKTWMPSDCQGL